MIQLVEISTIATQLLMTRQRYDQRRDPGYEKRDFP